MITLSSAKMRIGGRGNMLRTSPVRVALAGRSVLSTLAAAFLCLTFAGCGVTRDQLDAVGAFGKSATTLADGVKVAYLQAERNEVDLRFGTI
jgi:hypothetical protein